MDNLEVESFKVPKKIVKLADSVQSHLLSARVAEAEIIKWIRSKGYEPNDSDVFGMFGAAESDGKQFAQMLESAIVNGELEEAE